MVPFDLALSIHKTHGDRWRPRRCELPEAIGRGCVCTDPRTDVLAEAASLRNTLGVAGHFSGARPSPGYPCLQIEAENPRFVSILEEDARQPGVKSRCVIRSHVFD